MATGTASGGNGHLIEVLDGCLDRLRQGDSLEDCLIDYAGLAGELEPLLRTASVLMRASVVPPSVDLALGRSRLLAAATARRLDEAIESLGQTAGTGAAEPLDDGVAACARLARDIGAAVVAPPRPPTGLARGRDRLLAAAADRRLEREAEGQVDLAAAVDEAIIRGASPDPEAAELAELARRIAEDVVKPPVADAAVAAVRKRFLAEARTRRRRQAPARGLARLLPRARTSRVLTASRLAAASIAAALFVAVGGSMLVPATASALPGDSLYSVKLIGERLQLALAFDPADRSRIEAEHSRTRGRELLALADKGREAEIIDWRVFFKALSDLAKEGELPHGVLLVSVPDEDGQATVWTLEWNDRTLFELGESFEAPADIPEGTLLKVRVALLEDREPMAISVAVADGGPLQPATPQQDPEPTLTAALPSSATPEPTSTIGQTPTAAETPTEEPSVEPFASDTADPILTGKPDRDRLRGVVELQTSDIEWMVRTDAEHQAVTSGGKLVKVDASKLPSDVILSVKLGDWIQLVGRYLDRDQTVFLAQALDRHSTDRSQPEKVGCSTNFTVGFVTTYVPVISLTLSDGSSYDLSGLGVQVAPAGLQAGSRVRIEYEQCGDGKRAAKKVEVLNAPAETTLRGTVEKSRSGEFELITRSGSRFTVAYDDETAITGAGAIKNGQTVQARGWLEGDSRLHAVEIRVREAEAEASHTPGAVPPATSESVGQGVLLEGP